jgi:hypothetical protein
MEQNLINAFHLMWDNFPEPVILIHKDRTIVAINKACEITGVQTNTKCLALQPSERHKGCKANEALMNKEASYRKRKGDFGDVIAFWLPIDECQEYLIHFSVGRKDYENS